MIYYMNWYLARLNNQDLANYKQTILKRTTLKSEIKKKMI
jgi:hypothetical protein